MFWATSVVVVRNDPVEKPMPPPKINIPIPVMESKPKAIAAITNTGANGIKIWIAWLEQITANETVRMTSSKYLLFFSF